MKQYIFANKKDLKVKDEPNYHTQLCMCIVIILKKSVIFLDFASLRHVNPG